MSVQVELVDPERVLLEEIADDRLKQADIALTYAFALKQPDEVDWSKVNRAILARWSMAGLKRIKTEAWKRIEGRSA